MEKDSYLVIFGSEDGGCSCKKMTKAEVLKILTPNKYGDYDYGKREILWELPAEIDNFVDMVIIKGEIVVPKAKEVVTEYELP